jgi:hemoglobin/transferrin/lactoferrin receptor protein
LFAAVPGYVLLGVRAGVELGEGRSLLADFENALDRNYRGVSWGVDGPGRGVSVRFVQRF